jgi:hypothetical protein
MREDYWFVRERNARTIDGQSPVPNNVRDEGKVFTNPTPATSNLTRNFNNLRVFLCLQYIHQNQRG